MVLSPQSVTLSTLLEEQSEHTLTLTRFFVYRSSYVYTVQRSDQAMDAVGETRSVSDSVHGFTHPHNSTSEARS